MTGLLILYLFGVIGTGGLFVFIDQLPPANPVDWWHAVWLVFMAAMWPLVLPALGVGYVAAVLIAAGHKLACRT